MAILPCTNENADHLANLRRLVAGRWVVLAILFLVVLMGPGILDIPVPQPPLLGIIAVIALFNAIAQWRVLHSQAASTGELFTQVLFDIGALSAIVFFSGGATNPLVSLLLPPVAVAALTLPARCVAAVSAMAIIAYSLLMLYFIPLPMADATRATRLHLIGMWLIFVVSTAMIGWLIVRMTRQIRERDAELAATREQALRDERVMAMGTLAAGAAHELGTPLGTMALLAGELANDPSLGDAAREDIALLRQQIGVCKQIITGLSRRAGAERLDNVESVPADRWLDSLRQHWHAARPQAGSRLIIASDGSAPSIAADPRLEQAILNLLNNAANATPRPLDIRLSWCSENLCIDIRDHGPGFPSEILATGGQSSFPAHERGSGVGLILTRTAIEQLGGRLTLFNPDDGGALARIELPRAKP
ncbi:MAG TPA: ATP-binding protein [Azonexus sp.]|nr:ATP-binding protein [Azonexus sp.]